MWMGVGCPCPPVRNDIVTDGENYFFLTMRTYALSNLCEDSASTSVRFFSGISLYTRPKEMFWIDLIINLIVFLQWMLSSCFKFFNFFCSLKKVKFLMFFVWLFSALYGFSAHHGFVYWKTKTGDSILLRTSNFI